MLPWLLRIWRLLPSPVRMVYLRVRYGHFGVGVSALISDEQGRILLVHRTYSRDEPWSLPGGWLERSDRFIERALEREMLEETGLRIKVGPVRAVQRAGFAVVMLMQADLLDSTADFRRSAEVSEIAWVDPARVAELSRINRRLLERVVE